MDWLKKHWGNISAIAGPLIAFLTPSIHAYVIDHPKTVLGVIMAALLWFYNSTAPKDSPRCVAAGKTPNA